MIFLPVILASFALFSQAQMTVPVLPPLSKAQQLSFSVAMTQMSQKSTAQNMLAQDVNNAAAAAVGISQNFTKIAGQLLEIDNLHLQAQTFEPTWLGFRDRYNTILQQSKNFASEVSAYADAFDNTALGLVTDPSFDIPTKLGIMQSFIDQSTGFQQKSNNFSTLFQNLASDMEVFTKNFANFASTRATADNGTIADLNIQITKIMGEMTALTDSMLALGVAAGGVLIATPIALAFLPEAAPFIVIGAAITAGLIAASEIGLEVAYSVEGSMLDMLQSQKQGLLNEISLINSTQNLLNQTVTQDIVATANSVQLFDLVWQDVADDSSKIVEWLNMGADPNGEPTVIGTWVNVSATMYGTLSTALSNYAVFLD